MISSFPKISSSLRVVLYICIFIIFQVTLLQKSYLITYLTTKSDLPKQNYTNRNPDPIVTIYAITATKSRAAQKADLTRLSQTLLHLKNFHWIIVEDSDDKTPLVSKLLERSGLSYTHLFKRTPKKYRDGGEDHQYFKGVPQRNAALSWIRKMINDTTLGVVYFMDDDNTYTLRLFDEMRSTKLASTWPIGFSGRLTYEGPVICRNGKVLGWRTWQGSKLSKRPLPIDMAGFALNITLLFQHKDVNFDYIGYLESDFLTKFGLRADKMEAKADDCTTILVWHTRTMKPNFGSEKDVKRGDVKLLEY